MLFCQLSCAFELSDTLYVFHLLTHTHNAEILFYLSSHSSCILTPSPPPSVLTSSSSFSVSPPLQFSSSIHCFSSSHQYLCIHHLILSAVSLFSPPSIYPICMLLFHSCQYISPDVVKMIIGNKCDLHESREVSTERGQQVSGISACYVLQF